ncbi:riboflavin synthase [Actinomadura graeca]|uniref:Riboflavin synthase n=1 Tax=Actinomadura graeca TaxID=2750812 RepID=A0ABX8R2N1_9ACTN|nr:riboflavin synthase [Actinomadura graeca]QXJ25341.1 riboflavin synthase [Actinomadura graeca]
MFTGIVEELGEIVAIEHHGDSAVLAVRGPLVTKDAVHGASIAVSGVCLTVVDVKGEVFTADAVKETLDRSSLGGLGPGAKVNLERPLRLSDRLGGHLVQGHVDGVGEIVSREPGERWDVVTVSLPPGLSRYLVGKGSITVDGVSLTVVEAGGDRFSVALIPTTLSLTTLGHKKPGDPVNLEVDVVAKYVERMIGDRP